MLQYFHTIKIVFRLLLNIISNARKYIYVNKKCCKCMWLSDNFPKVFYSLHLKMADIKFIVLKVSVFLVYLFFFYFYLSYRICIALYFVRFGSLNAHSCISCRVKIISLIIQPYPLPPCFLHNAVYKVYWMLTLLSQSV